jgi:hypothetical protein
MEPPVSVHMKPEVRFQHRESLNVVLILSTGTELIFHIVEIVTSVCILNRCTMMSRRGKCFYHQAHRELALSRAISTFALAMD